MLNSGEAGTMENCVKTILDNPEESEGMTPPLPYEFPFSRKS